jgi:lysophospholipase L1-like esterase
VVPAPNYHDPGSFPGYPEQLGSELHLIVANAACPGETSASLINQSARSNGCENGYRVGYPRHVRYHGSQLAYALTYLHAHRDVRLVSLMIGANDVLLCFETTNDRCASSAELDAALQQVSHNVRRILRTIRKKAHYRGQLVIVNYYSPLAAFNPSVIRLNHAIDAAANPFGVLVANGYGEFQRADSRSDGNPCTAGLLTQLGTPGKCGIHPSYAGQALLAEAVEKVIRL